MDVNSNQKCIEEAFLCLKRKDWGNAEYFCDIVLKFDLKCGMAYIGKLLACIKVCELDALQFYSEQLTQKQEELLQKAIYYSDEKTKILIIEVIEHRKQRIYEKATRLAEKNEKYQDASRVFKSLGDYRDAPQRAKMCYDMYSIHDELSNSILKNYRSIKAFHFFSMLHIILSYISLSLVVSTLYYSVRSWLGNVCFIMLVFNLILTMVFVLKLMKFGKALRWCITYWEIADGICEGPLVGFIGTYFVLVAFLVCSVFVLICSPVFSIIFYVNISRKAREIKTRTKAIFITVRSQLEGFKAFSEQKGFLKDQLQKMIAKTL